jgi:hypothetical protein
VPLFLTSLHSLYREESEKRTGLKEISIKKILPNNMWAAAYNRTPRPNFLLTGNAHNSRDGFFSTHDKKENKRPARIFPLFYDLR